MSQDLSRRSALSLIAVGGSLALTLSGALEPSEAQAATATAEVSGAAGTERRHKRRTSRRQKPAVQPVAAPSQAAPTECKPTSQTEYYSCQYK